MPGFETDANQGPIYYQPIQYGVPGAPGTPTTQQQATNPHDYAAINQQNQDQAEYNAAALGRPDDPYQGENIMGQKWVGSAQNALSGIRPGYDTQDWSYIRNPNAYQYGGVRGGAAQEEQRYGNMSQMAGYNAGAAGAGFNQQIGLANQSRDQQMQGLGYLQNQINGNGPSVAQAQMNQGLSSARNQQASIAASARGGGANLAAAQQASANAAAGLSGQAVQQGATLRAGEQMNAMNAYNQAAGQMRSGDFQGANMQTQQQNMYNQQQNQYEGMRANVYQTQMQGQQAGEQQNAAREAAQQGLAYNSAQAAQQHSDNTLGTVLSTVGTGLGLAIAASDERIKENVSSADNDIDDALKKLKPVKYTYKDPKWGAGEQTGIMAQHLESSRAGKGSVAELPDGTKVVKAPQAANLALAGLARLAERLDKVEAKRAGSR